MELKEGKIMLIDLHAHTSPISPCCKGLADRIISDDMAAGIDGVVLTNHYQKSYVEDRFGTLDNFAKAYTDEYHKMKLLGDEKGFKVFYGMEISMEPYNRLHMLVYGITPEFTLEHPDVFDLDHEQLYKLVKDNGGMLVQAHPFREAKHKVMELSLLDGLEANSHPFYNGTFHEKLTELCHIRGLILTSGGDYHADTAYRAHCGAFLPEGIRDEKQLCDFLMTTPSIDLELHEPNVHPSYRITYVRKP